jgi:hypothetical protein
MACEKVAGDRLHNEGSISNDAGPPDDLFKLFEAKVARDR